LEPWRSRIAGTFPASCLQLEQAAQLLADQFVLDQEAVMSEI
jgi:hypothetical protein